MSTLWIRASARERQAMRIVAGAVMNARDAHPEVVGLDEKFARSVSKRAIGTLSAAWPSGLAASERRSSDAETGQDRTRLRREADVREPRERGSAIVQHRRPPLAAIIRAITRQIRPLKDAGQNERAEGMIECLRIIDRIVKESP